MPRLAGPVFVEEDRSKVGRIVDALRRRGVATTPVPIMPGPVALPDLEASLANGGQVIVAWSAVAAASPVLRDVAARGVEGRNLILVQLDRTPPPLGALGLPHADFRRWRGGLSGRPLVILERACRAASQDRTPMAGRFKIAALAAVGALFTVSVSVFGVNIMGFQDQVCGWKALGPGVSDVCGWAGLGHRPKRDDRLAWAKVRPDDCEDLAGYVRAHAEGAYVQTATALLATRAPGPTATPERRRMSFPFALSVDDSAAASEAAARTAALPRAQTRAQGICAQYAAAHGGRSVAADLRAIDWSCTSDAGWACGLSADLVCEAETTVRRDVCRGKPTS